MFLSSAMNFVSFLFVFVFVVVFSFALALSLLSASVQCYKGGTAERTITWLPGILWHLQVTIFSFARASRILILYYEKWLIINSAIFSNSCPVIAEMHLLSQRFPWRAVNSQWARGRKVSNLICWVQTHRGRVVFLLLASFPTVFFTTQEHSTTIPLQPFEEDEISRFLCQMNFWGKTVLHIYG